MRSDILVDWSISYLGWNVPLYGKKSPFLHIKHSMLYILKRFPFDCSLPAGPACRFILWNAFSFVKRSVNISTIMLLSKRKQGWTLQCDLPAVYVQRTHFIGVGHSAPPPHPSSPCHPFTHRSMAPLSLGHPRGFIAAVLNQDFSHPSP